jgi:N-acetylglucosamine-6-sulfatase
VLEVLESRVVPSASAWDVAAVTPMPRTDPYAAARLPQELSQLPGAQVVFLGDSITDYWQRLDTSAWDRELAPLHAADLAIAGNLANNVLWQVNSGMLAGRPRVVVLEAGTNNLALGESAAATAAGVAADVAAIRAASPGSQVLLMGIFPRGTGATDPLTQEADAVNAALAKLADGTHVHFLNIDADFLNPDGSLNQALFVDRLHPSAQGYAVWAGDLTKPLDALLGQGNPGPVTSPATTTTASSTTGPEGSFLLVVLPPSQDPAAANFPGLSDLQAHKKDHAPGTTS